MYPPLLLTHLTRMFPTQLLQKQYWELCCTCGLTQPLSSSWTALLRYEKVNLKLSWYCTFGRKIPFIRTESSSWERVMLKWAVSTADFDVFPTSFSHRSIKALYAKTCWKIDGQIVFIDTAFKIVMLIDITFSIKEIIKLHTSLLTCFLINMVWSAKISIGFLLWFCNSL